MSQSVARSFLKAVDRQRSSSAIVTEQRTWSYEELGGLAGAVSGFLGSAGLERGDSVALLLPNSAEYVAACFGTYMSGCVVVALNTQEPAPVIARLISHCEAKVLFVDESFRELERLRDLLSGTALQLVSVSEDSPAWQEITSASSLDCHRHVVDTRSTDLAAIIYTSGTTGNPKGVMLSHRNLSANTASIVEYLDISWVDRAFNVLPFYYSFGNSILLTHMTVGACIILQNHIAFPHAVLKRIGDENASSFYGVPTTYSLLFDSDRIAAADLTSLRYIAQAGGPMSVDKQTQLMNDLPHVRIYVMYGQTEATARLTYLDPDRARDKAGSVGKAIPGVEIRVGSSFDQRHDVNSPGEVYARGENIMMGYWNNATATSEAIRDGWLRTGDLGYFDNEGFLYLTGRSSDMIKTGANRVSPAEIEDVVNQFPDVEEVAAYAVPDEVLGEAIAVAIVPSPGRDLDAQGIQRYCLGELSHYKVPRYVRFVTSLPKTGSGKVRRHVLAQEHEESTSSE